MEDNHIACDFGNIMVRKAEINFYEFYSLRYVLTSLCPTYVLFSCCAKPNFINLRVFSSNSHTAIFLQLKPIVLLHIHTVPSSLAPSFQGDLRHFFTALCSMSCSFQTQLCVIQSTEFLSLRQSVLIAIMPTFVQQQCNLAL